uniref:Uncharacterized protein n=1 Tax=Desertifilum tharense IPPAS B-1220 TaxID=1781255 RepID=A0ACD5GWU2_9CYAN
MLSGEEGGGKKGVRSWELGVGEERWGDGEVGRWGGGRWGGGRWGGGEVGGGEVGGGRWGGGEVGRWGGGRWGKEGSWELGKRLLLRGSWGVASSVLSQKEDGKIWGKRVLRFLCSSMLS